MKFLPVQFFCVILDVNVNVLEAILSFQSYFNLTQHKINEDLNLMLITANYD